MTIDELAPLLRHLPRADKWRAIHLLMNELAAEEEALLQPGVEYLAWSQHDAYDAARTLMDVLDAENRSDD
jgi:hypothetical protein